MTSGRELELRLHMRGTPIRMWRQLLKRLGYSITETTKDYFDLDLEDQTKHFQRDHGLTETGIVDSLTLETAENQASKRGV